MTTAHTLPEFTEAFDAYLDTLYRTGSMNIDDDDVVQLDEELTFDDVMDGLTPDALRGERDTLVEFIASAEYEGLLDPYLGQRKRGYADFGHDFALTRNDLGTGFWDRGLGDVGERLTALADSYGSSEMHAWEDSDGDIVCAIVKDRRCQEGQA